MKDRGVNRKNDNRMSLPTVIRSEQIKALIVVCTCLRFSACCMAYLGTERTGWAQTEQRRWCKWNTRCRWRETFLEAGERCHLLNRLTQPAGRHTWSGRSERIKCCLEIAQGIGRRGEGEDGRTQKAETKHRETDHPDTPTNTENRREKLSEISKLHAWFRIQPSAHKQANQRARTNICTWMHEHREGTE